MESDEDIARAAARLGLAYPPSQQAIKRAYRASVLAYHPDRHAGASPQMRKFAQGQFKLVNNANELLTRKWKETPFMVEQGMRLPNMNQIRAEQTGERARRRAAAQRESGGPAAREVQTRKRKAQEDRQAEQARDAQARARAAGAAEAARGRNSAWADREYRHAAREAAAREYDPVKETRKREAQAAARANARNAAAAAEAAWGRNADAPWGRNSARADPDDLQAQREKWQRAREAAAREYDPVKETRKREAQAAARANARNAAARAGNEYQPTNKKTRTGWTSWTSWASWTGGV
jgi:curved DNA-binding protein CbpA